MMEELEIDSIEILHGRDDGDPTPRWYVNMVFTDGTCAIVDRKTSYAEAWISALEDGVHVADLTRRASPLS